MRSLFGLVLFIAMPLVACVGILISSSRISLVHTGNDFDVAILGRGYLLAIPENGDREDGVLLRDARFFTDDIGRLSTMVEGNLFCLDPQIDLPMNWREIRFGREGSVANSEGFESNFTQCGAISLFVTPKEDGSERKWMKDIDKGYAETIPGQDGAGFLMQGYRRQRVVPLNFSSLAVLAVLCSTSIMSTWVFRSKLSASQS